MLTIMSRSIVDTVGELPEKAERNDGQCVEARFIAPRGGVGMALADAVRGTVWPW